MDKEELQKLLKQFTQEEIREALGQKPKDKKRRRGKGKRKKSPPTNNQEPKTVNKFDDMISNISLSADEKKELAEAEQSDIWQNRILIEGRGTLLAGKHLGALHAEETLRCFLLKFIIGKDGSATAA